MLLEFMCSIVYGQGDSNDWGELIEVSQSEYKRLKKAVLAMEDEDCEEVYDFCEHPMLEDIYERIYEEVDIAATNSLLEDDPDAVEDYLEDYDDPDEFRASDIYEIIVNYPEFD